MPARYTVNYKLWAIGFQLACLNSSKILLFLKTAVWASGMRVMVRQREMQSLFLFFFFFFCPECNTHTLTWINGILKTGCVLTGVPWCLCVLLCACMWWSLLQGHRMWNLLSRGEFWVKNAFLNKKKKRFPHWLTLKQSATLQYNVIRSIFFTSILPTKVTMWHTKHT